MRVFVTGSSGFIGRVFVRAARTAGHEVVALVRRPTDIDRLGWADDAGISGVVGDVRVPSSYQSELAGCDIVCHLAASFGDFAEQFSVNVVGTERLLQTMDAASVRRLVLVSSFSLYDYRACAAGSQIVESSPIEARPEDRDPYTQTKVYQERLTREFCADHSIDLTVVRPGAVFGEDHLWAAGAALNLGPVALSFAPRSDMKLTEVGNCADALVLAMEDRAIGETVNVVDDDPPTHMELNAAMRKAGFDVPRLVPVPYRVASTVAGAFAALNRTFFAGRAKFPAIVVPAKLDAMFKPFTYPNDHAKSVLGWTPRRSLDEALREIPTS